MYAISAVDSRVLTVTRTPPAGRDAEVRLEHRRRVREQRRDAVALAETGITERVREPPRALTELRVGVPALAVHERDLVRVDERRALEQVDRVQLGAEDLHGHFSSIRLHSPREKCTEEPSAREMNNAAGHAWGIVVATGPFQVPHVPAIGEALGGAVQQMHSTGYRRASDLPEGTVLVVGGGNTGYQIAKELASTRSVHLAIGSRQKPLPQRILGRDLFWWLTKLGLLRKTRDSRLGSKLRERDTLIGSSPPPAWQPWNRRACARHRRFGQNRDVRRRHDARRRRRRLGDRLPLRLLVARPPGARRERADPPSPRRQRRPRPLLPRPLLAAHPRLGAPRLGRGRRRVHLQRDRALRGRCDASGRAESHRRAAARQTAALPEGA